MSRNRSPVELVDTHPEGSWIALRNRAGLAGLESEWRARRDGPPSESPECICAIHESWEEQLRFEWAAVYSSELPDLCDVTKEARMRW